MRPTTAHNYSGGVAPVQPQTIQLEAFHVVGYRLEATVQEFEITLSRLDSVSRL